MRVLQEMLSMLIGGAFFGFGLAYSGMISPEVVIQFLNLKNFGLLLVMGGAVVVTFLFYQLMPLVSRKPLFGIVYEKRVVSLDKKLIVGSAIFGIGWGISGVCPGPAIAGLGIGNFSLLWSLGGIFIGAYLHALWASRNTQLFSADISG